MEKLQILEEYNFYDNVQVFLYNKEEILDDLSKDIPSYWFEALSEENSKDKVEKIINMWENILGNELSNTINYLKQNLRDIDLVKIGKNFFLFYSIATQNGEELYYLGGIPMDYKDSVDEANGKIIPQLMKKFYTQLHNGFYDYCSKSMGLVEFENITCLADDEWGILEDNENPLEININTTFSFFDNGMGGYVAMDFKTCKSVIWFVDEQPIFDIQFWDVVDEWIVLGMQE